MGLLFFIKNERIRLLLHKVSQTTGNSGCSHQIHKIIHQTKNNLLSSVILPDQLKASGGIDPFAFASLKTTAALSKSQLFSSRHWAEYCRFIPDF